MEEPKTLSYDWQYGREELFLRVDSYMSDDNLYIGLYHMEDGYPESFADLTVNLPFASLGGINEAYIDHNFSDTQNRCGETSAILVQPIETYLLKLIPYRFCMPPLISQGFALPASPRGSLCPPMYRILRRPGLRG